jgi:membrane protease YdiL (CAAX protease family)
MQVPTEKRFLRNIAERYPIAFSILLVPVIIGLLIPLRILKEVLLNSVPIYFLQTTALTFEGIIVVIILILLSSWKEFGFNKPSQWRCLYLYWLLAPLIVPVLLYILVIGTKVDKPILIFFYAWLTIFIGFSEESLFRGVILTTLRRYGTILSVLFSSLLFSLVHITNLMAGFSWNYILVQLYVAFSLGVLFAALRIRTGTIWLVILLHSLIDFLGLITKDQLNWTGTGGMPEINLQVIEIIVIFYSVFVIVGLFLLRPRKTAIL